MAQSRADRTEPESVLVESAGDGFRQRLSDGRHELTADEPLAAGGADAGPSPYELLLMSLGACTSMTLSMYAKRKGWPLEKVRVHLKHDRIHAEDCRDCETKEGLVDRIDRAIEMKGPLSDEQRGRLLEIADKCPVHKTLTSEIKIVTRYLP
ncbi:MAG TPA: OsmC family protein [Alphaproteobacteria bacterium]|nr:OsmC family protein [Alphaproteobacteria bacterium]